MKTLKKLLTGYPDGTYKGQQQTTRYEMASALARALAVVDMEKASKQDVELLKRLTLEFKDELEALGVKVSELDDRVGVLEDRLGGWHIHGALVLDVKNESAKNAADTDGDGYIGFDNARVFFERTWGENDEYFFRARLRNDGDDNDGFTNNNGNSAFFDRYYVTMPFFFDTRLTVGRFLYDVDTAYRPDLAYASHSNRTHPNMRDTKFVNPITGVKEGVLGGNNAINARAWALFMMGQFQFTEQIGLDIGGQAFFGDNAETARDNGAQLNDLSFNNLWTVFAGLRFNFNDAIAIKGAFYHQEIDSERVENVNGQNKWVDYGYGLRDGNSIIDDANHWRAIIDVKQEALKFTSLWLEYGQYDAGFFTPQGISTIFPSEAKVITDAFTNSASVLADTKYWRVVLGQEWNEKWATHLFYYGYKVENGKGNEDAKPSEFGLGVQYKLNDATTMGLNYVHAKNDLDGDDTKDNIIRFRTAISF